jgi:superfamily II DNA/RNA helicase
MNSLSSNRILPIFSRTAPTCSFKRTNYNNYKSQPYQQSQNYQQKNYQSQNYQPPQQQRGYTLPVGSPDDLFTPLEKKPKTFKVDYTEHSEVAGTSPVAVEKWRKEQQISIMSEKNEKCPNPILQFKQAPFPERVVKYLEKNYQSPTFIQSQTWPIVLSGKDMVGSAKTGSGKTLAFILPALEHIRTQNSSGFPTALVLAPTRELVQQIQAEADKFTQFYNIESACFFGGSGNRLFQSRSISKRPQLVIAAPGRLIDFVLNNMLSLNSVSYLVLDEADRMLDMGFEPSIRQIVKQTGSRQTLMFSATWPKAVQSLCKDYLIDPIRVNVGPLELSANPDIEQKFIFCKPHEKLSILIDLLKKNNLTKTLVFVGSKRDVDTIARHLAASSIADKYPFATLHGDKVQSHRNNIYQDFQNGTLKMVIATDLASRGLDVKDIELVIYFDLPHN